MSTEVSVAALLTKACEDAGFVESPIYFPPIGQAPETIRDGQFTVVAQSWGPVQVTPTCLTTPEQFDIVIEFVAHAQAPQDWWRREVSPRIQSLVDVLARTLEVNSVSGRYSPESADSLVLTATITVGVEHDR